MCRGPGAAHAWYISRTGRDAVCLLESWRGKLLNLGIALGLVGCSYHERQVGTQHEPRGGQIPCASVLYACQCHEGSNWLHLSGGPFSVFWFLVEHR